MLLLSLLLGLAMCAALHVGRTMKQNIDVVQSIAPAVKTATATGTGVDLRNYDSAMAVFQFGALVGAGLFALTIEESDDDVTYATVAAADLDWSGGAVAVPTANSTQRVGYLGAKRYIRPVATYTSGTSLAIGASVNRGHAVAVPLA